MKRNIFLIFVSFIVLQTAAQSIDTLFIKMPAHLFPLLKDRQRLELVENFKAAQSDTMRNLFDGKTWITAMSSNHLRINNGTSAVFELFRFSDKNQQTVFGIIRTAGVPPSSALRLYDRNWAPLSSPFPQVRAADWIDTALVRQSGYSRNEIAAVFAADFIELRYNANAHTLEAINHSTEYLAPPERKKVEGLMTKEVKILKDFSPGLPENRQSDHVSPPEGEQ